MTEFIVQHLSYSAVKQYCANRYGFKRRYIDGLYDDVIRPAGLIGQAGHLALQRYVETKGDYAAAVNALEIHILSTPDAKINWGKTGNREKCLKYARQGLDHYLNEVLIDFDKILGVELMMKQECAYKGVRIPMPLKCYSDKVILEIDDDGNKCLDIVDYKFKDKFSDMSLSNAAYTIQGMINMLCCHAEFGVAPRKITFREIKVTMNRDGGSQIQDHTIYFNESHQDMIVFLNLLHQVLGELDENNPRAAFLPNFWDFYDGQKAWDSFIEEMVDWGIPNFSEFY